MLQDIQNMRESGDYISLSVYMYSYLSFLCSNHIIINADKFCYNCILHWSKVVATKHSQPPSSVKCPLCKVCFGSVILLILY